MQDLKTKIIIIIIGIIISIGVIYNVISNIQEHQLNTVRLQNIYGLLVQTINIIQAKKSDPEELNNKMAEFTEQRTEILINTDKIKTKINKWTIVLTTYNNELCDLISIEGRQKSIKNEQPWSDTQIIDDCDKMNQISFILLNNK